MRGVLLTKQANKNSFPTGTVDVYAPASEAPFLPLFFAAFDVAAAVAQLVVAQAVVFKIRTDIADRCLGDVVQRVLRQEGLVGGDDDVGHGDQPGQQVVAEDVAGQVPEEDVQLLLIYVKAGRADFAGLDALQKRLRVDERPAGGIQDHHALFHTGNGVCVDHVTGLRRQGTVDRDDIAALKQLVKGNVVDAAVRRGEFVIGDHLHAEATADVDENAADLARADDAYGFAVEIKAGEAVQGEVELPGAVIGLVDAADGGEQQRHGVFRHGIGRIGRHVNHVDLAEGMLDIHVVVTRRAQGDQLHAAFVQAVDDRGVHRIVDKDAHRLAPVRQRRGILIQFGLVKLELHPLLRAVGFKRRHIVGLGVKKCHFHVFLPLLL